MESADWYFTHAGVEFGPMDDTALCNAADTGLLLPTDEVRREDLPHAVPAAEIKGLFREETAADSSVTDSDAPLTDDSRDGSSVYQPDIVGTGSVTCVHCWYQFEPEDVLFIARHPDLAGSSILGSEEQQRFLPSRFTPQGHAIDAEGLICPDMACPRCHMRLPRSLVSMKPLFVSLVGAPASGKSYFLASMSWKLRTTLPEQFLISFADADGSANQWLTDYEERLFVQTADDALQSIDKTQLRGDLYKEISLSGMRTSVPLPSVFTLQAEEFSLYHQEHPDRRIKRSLVLYDNAGEHFEPGRDSAADPGTQHLLHAESILFMLDPTKSPRFRKVLCRKDDPQLVRTSIVQRQDTVFTETLNRIRLNLGMDGAQRYTKPVVVLLSKADLLGDDFQELMRRNPWEWHDEWQTHCLDVSYLMQASYKTRALILKHVPEIVSTIEAFANDVIYMPVSALGCSPLPDPNHEGHHDSALLVVRTGDIAPKWVEVPLLYVLFKLGYIGGMAHQYRNHPEPEEYEIRGGMFHFMVPGTSRRIRLPLSYASYSLCDPETGVWFRVPDARSE